MGRQNVIRHLKAINSAFRPLQTILNTNQPNSMENTAIYRAMKTTAPFATVLYKVLRKRPDKAGILYFPFSSICRS